MGTNMRSRLLVAGMLVFLAGLTAFTQPGLCPCWLIKDVRYNHPHFDGHPERPHNHNYLFEMFPAGTAVLAEPELVPAAGLILALALAALWLTVTDAAATARAWVLPPLIPPPR